MYYGIYRFLTHIASPAVPLLLAHRLDKGKEDAKRLNERLGEASKPRPAGKLVWLHAASVGESNAVLPLIEALLAANPSLHVLLTSVTVTSAALMQTRLPARAIHQFAPVDTPGATAAFIKHWKPDIALWVDSELWPNLIMQARKSGAIMGMINARMSERSFRSWRYAGAFIRQMLGCFSVCFAQSTQDAERLQQLGMQQIDGIGNLKYDAAALSCDADELQKLKKKLFGRTVWLAASTHAPEEEIVVRAHGELKKQFPGLLTILIPRHAKRGDELAEQFSAVRLAQRSLMQEIMPETEIYLADTMGELGLFYRLAPVVFIGKSLGGNHGGQNPLEAAQLGCCIVTGIHTENFEDIYAQLEREGACVRVSDEPGLTRVIDELLPDNARVKQYSERALAHVQAHGGQLEPIMKALQPALGSAKS